MFDLQVLVNSRKETELKNPGTGAFLELDIWLPKHNICFEFQVNSLKQEMIINE